MSMSSIYEHATDRAALARNRKKWVGEEVPKCGFYFDNSNPEACDIPASHICGPSELTVALQEAGIIR
jgi:hypothetical protein